MRQRYLVMALLCFLGTILYLDRVCISFALPAMQKDLGIEQAQLGWISLAFSIAYAIFEIPGGYMGDRYGARKTLTRITIWWSAFTALTGAAFGFVSLVITRFLFGAGEAGAWPNVATVVGKWFPAKSRARAMGVFGASTAVGGGLAPLIVVPLQDAYGWRASFFIFAALGMVWAVVWYRWFRDDPAAGGASPKERAELGEVPAPAAHGLRWSVALRQPTIWALMVQCFAGVYAAFFAVFWLPMYLGQARAFTAPDMKLLSVFWLCSLLGNAFGGWVSDGAVIWLGRARGRRVAGAVCMVISGSLFLAVTQTHDKGLLVAELCGTGLMWGVIQSNMFATCIDVGGRHVGTVAGTMNTAGQIGGGLSALLFGYIAKYTGSMETPVIVMGLSMVLGATAWIWIDAAKPLVAFDDEPAPATAP